MSTPIADAERAIVGALLLAETPEAAVRVVAEAGDLGRADFRGVLVGQVWEAARVLTERGALPDPVSVVHSLGAVSGNVAAFVGELLDGVPRVSNVLAWAERVREKSRHPADRWEGSPEKGLDIGARARDRGPHFEWADAFLQRVGSEPERAAKVRELWPDEGVVLRHGRPRSMKSFAILEECLAATSGSGPAFHCERFEVPRPVRVCYLTEEDSERIVRTRLHWLMVGREVTDAGPLALLCRPGWNLETELGAEGLVAELRRLEPEVLYVDPARASMPSIDGGPKDGAAGAMLVRRILRETSVRVIGFGAHDTKPTRDGIDVRARAERASGGVLFSIADAPIGLTRQSDRETLALPSQFKQGADPKPFLIRFESAAASGPFREFVRATAVPYEDTEDAAAPQQRDALLRLLDERGVITTSEAEAALLGARNGTAARHLAALERVGKVQAITGKVPLASLAEALGRKKQWPANAVVWSRGQA